jgi:hypothetical protein
LVEYLVNLDDRHLSHLTLVTGTMPRPSLQELIRRQENERAASNKSDYIFLTAEQRRTRVAKTTEECDFFLKKYVALLDSAHEKGEKVGISLDIECDYVLPGHKPFRRADPHFWAKYLFPGVSRDKLTKRKEENKNIKKAYDKLKEAAIDDDKELKDLYWRRNSNLLSSGLPQSNVMAIQLASTGDPEGDLVFAIDVSELIKANRGRVKLPDLMETVLSHPAVIFVNANQFEDLDAVVNQFYGGRQLSIRYVEAHQFFKKAWGPNWNGVGKTGGPKSSSGVRQVFEYGFKEENLTWFKNVRCTCSHWWAKEWSDEQIHYGLMDSRGVVMVFDKVFGGKPGQSLDKMAIEFPLRFYDPTVKARRQLRNTNRAVNGVHLELEDS